MRVVLDTNVLVRATPASSGGPARALFELLLARPHTLVTSLPLIDEAAAVLLRPGLRRLHGMADEVVEEFVAGIELLSDVVSLPSPLPTFVPDDPKDGPIVDTAISGRADVICTRDRHLLHPDVLAICAASGIRVLSDIELLHELRADTAGGSVF